MGFPPGDAVETTLAFLKSERGMRQALYLSPPFLSSTGQKQANARQAHGGRRDARHHIRQME